MTRCAWLASNRESAGKVSYPQARLLALKVIDQRPASFTIQDVANSMHTLGRSGRVDYVMPLGVAEVALLRLHTTVHPIPPVGGVNIALHQSPALEILLYPLYST